MFLFDQAPNDSPLMRVARRINYGVQVLLSLGLTLALEPREWHRVRDLRCAGALRLRCRRGVASRELGWWEPCTHEG